MSQFIWTERAKEQIRQIDREQALQILHALTDYASSGKGQIKKLKGSGDLRLKVGDYLVRFEWSRRIRIESCGSAIGKKHIEVRWCGPSRLALLIHSDLFPARYVVPVFHRYPVETKMKRKLKPGTSFRF